MSISRIKNPYRLTDPFGGALEVTKSHEPSSIADPQTESWKGSRSGSLKSDLSKKPYRTLKVIFEGNPFEGTLKGAVKVSLKGTAL